MTKISWTCPRCAMWHSIPAIDLPMSLAGLPLLICRRCEYDATEEMAPDEPVTHMQSITYRLKP